MRTLVLIVLTLAVLAGGFAFYEWTQGPVPYQAGRKPPVQPTTASVDEAHAGSIGRGHDVSLLKKDRKTDLPVMKFSAADFLPEPDGRIKVDHPKALFFVGEKRDAIVSIEGETGWVALHGEGPRVRHDLTMAGPMDTPTRGDLYEVKVRYFVSEAALDAEDPEATMALHHVSFDVETYRIASEAFTDEAGVRVEADQVPIHVRGKKFDFDGWGLQLRWDELDQRLKNLRVAKGERLLIKDPKDFRFPGEQGAVSKTEISEAAGKTKVATVQPTSRAAAKPGAASAARPGRPKPTEVYRATFHDNVKVTQEDQQLAQGAAMNLDFMSTEAKENQTKGGGVVGAATQATPMVGGMAAQAAPGTATTQPATSSTAPAGEEKENAPIIVTWTGEFTVSPAPAAAIVPQDKHDAVIELVGPNTVVTADGNRLEADRVMYHVEPKVAYARGTPNLPVRFTDARGSTVYTESLEYSVGTPAKNMPAWAMLSGKSSAVLPTDIEGKTETMRASWSKLCTLHFAPGNGKKSGPIEMVEMTGAVNVEHPQIRRFKAERLVLEFDPKMAEKGTDPAKLTGKTLRKITADGNVDCVLVDTEGTSTAIRCQSLKLDTAIASNGKMYPTRLEAHGKVAAGDGAQAIYAENILASLVPGPTAGNGQKLAIGGLKDLAADGDVTVVSPDGGTMHGEKLRVVDVQEGKPKLVHIEGKDGGMATVSKDGRTLSGPVIELNMPDEYAHVIGGGSMRLGDASTPRDAAMPMQVVWSKDAVVDGKANVASVVGKVAVTYLAANGSINNAWAERADMRLATRKQTSGKTKKAGEVTFLADRFCDHLELTSASEKEDVQLQSVLPAVDGTLIRQMNVLGPKVICDFAEDTRAGAQVLVLQGVTVPAGKDRPGRMLFVDLPPTTHKAVVVKPGLESKGLHGATAFSWKDKLVYDRAAQTLTMLGDVVIRHEPKDRGAESFDVSAQRVTAELVEQRDVAGRAPAASKSNPDNPMPAPALKRLVAEGTPVWFKRDDLEFTAPLVEFDPVTHLAIGHSTERMPVHVDKGISPGDFREVQVNTETQMVQMLDARMTGRK